MSERKRCQRERDVRENEMSERKRFSKEVSKAAASYTSMSRRPVKKAMALKSHAWHSPLSRAQGPGRRSEG
eukprot:753985-Hanusia_phi.AAC.3